jgi:hypothetical protein
VVIPCVFRSTLLVYNLVVKTECTLPGVPTLRRRHANAYARCDTKADDGAIHGDCFITEFKHPYFVFGSK